MQSAGIPDADLVIRSGGERRLSNFLLWQAAYAELVFTDKLWPDFGAEDLEAALAEFARRERRFGGVPSDGRAPQNWQRLRSCAGIVRTQLASKG